MEPGGQHKGKEGHNVPVDMHMEHLNRTVKEYIAGVGANVSRSTIIQCGQSRRITIGKTMSIPPQGNM